MTNSDAKILELQLKTTGEKTLDIFEQLVKSLTGIENVLTNIYLEMGHIEKGSKNIVKDVKDIGTATDQTAKKVTNLGSALKGAFTFASIKRLGLKIMDFLGDATDRAEEMNLFNVIFKNVEKNGTKAFSEVGKEATKFQHKLNEAFGTNMTETLRYQGLFQAMATNQGISDKDALLMSENMTKLTYDLASLYNTSEKETAEALRAGVYAGQTKPLRKYGIDVTQTSFKPLMAELGIEKSVNELSQGEKQILRYIATLRQASSAMGDFADTIESPANQLKVFKQQLVETKTAIGNLFMGLYANILPYANAILMVIKEIAKAIASLFGIKARDYNTGLASTEDIYDGIADGAGKATKATKELKRQILGFDQINNITSPSKSGSSSGSGGVNTGIDKKLLTALSGYNNLMDEVQMKATKIRDSIMEWLGFTKMVDDETGEISFKFDHLTIGTLLTALGVGGTIYLGVKKIFEFFKGITGLKASSGGILGLLGKMLGAKSGGGESKGVAGEFGLPSIKTVLTGIGELAIVIGGVTAVILAIGALNSLPFVEDIATRGVDLLKQIFLGLGSIALPLAGISALTAILGAIGVKTVAQGFGDLAIILGGVTVLLTAIGAFISIPNFDTFLTVGIDSVKRAITGLTDVGTQLALFSAGILVLGFASPALIFSGLKGFAMIIGGLELVLVGLGVLAQLPMFNWLISEGGKALLTLGETLGGFAGSIVSGFLGVSTDGLEKIGDNLSKFMKKATPFFQGVSIVDEGTTRSVENLASAILKLTASNVLDGLFGWATGSNSFAKFGKDLADFAPSFRKYSEEMAGVKADVVEKTSKAVLTITEFAKEIPNEGGLLALAVGDNTLKQFASYLPDFGTKLKQYSNNIEGMQLDVVEKTSKAVETIMEFAKKVPNEGGFISWIVGDNKLDQFASYLPSFGSYLKSYSDNIKGIDTSVVQSTSNAVKSIMEFANNVPNEGGVKAWFSGDNKLSTFGEQLSLFGAYFKGYYNSISSIGLDTVNNVSKAIGELVAYLKEIKSNGLKDTLKDFGKEMKNSADNYKAFFTNNLTYTNGKTIGTNFADGIANGIKTKLKNFTFPSIKLTDASGNSIASYKIKAVAMGGVFNGKDWKNIPQYANGGVPAHGTLFQAGENGAEIVGNINRRTEVLNRSQIASAIYTAVSDAMSHANVGGGDIHLYAHTDEGVIIDKINRKTKQTGVCPINIPA